MWGFVILLAVAIILAAIVLVTLYWRNHNGKCCRRSSSSSSSNPCGCTPVIDASSSTLISATYARFGSADSVGSRHWAGDRGGPRLHSDSLATGTSSNWSGYVSVASLGATGIGTVTQVVGTWTVPTVTGPATGITYSSSWVGLDGFASPTVEQIGTEHDYVDGVPQLYAWYEMFPAGSVEIVGFPVSPGDSMSASVTYLGGGVFQLGMTNNTQGVSVLVPTADTTNVNALRSSAEWIVEAPSSGGGVLPLAELSTVYWSKACATINGVQGSICSPNRDDVELTMINDDSVPISVPSALTCNCTAFTVSQPSTPLP
jgi:hypothetical protein